MINKLKGDKEMINKLKGDKEMINKLKDCCVNNTIARKNKYLFYLDTLPYDAVYYSIEINNFGMQIGNVFQVQYYDVLRFDKKSLFSDFVKIMNDADRVNFRLISLRDDNDTEIREHTGEVIIDNMYMNYSWESKELSRFTVVFRNTTTIATKEY